MKLRRWRSAVLLAWMCLLPVQVARAHPAWGIRVTSEGEIYFADVERDRIWKINQRGTLVAVLKGKHSHDLWLDRAGNLFGEHTVQDAAADKPWQRSLWHFNEDGRLIELGVPPRGAGLARDAAGNQFSVESDAQTMRLLRRAPDGQVTVLAGGARGDADGPGAQARFSLLEAMAVGDDGTLYVRDNACIRRVTLSGEVTTIGGNPLAGVPRGAQPLILGLAVDARGNVFVADTEQGVVRRLGANGSVETVLATGSFWCPAGVTVVNDELYVLETISQSVLRSLLIGSGIGPYLRVQKLTASGRVQTLATVRGPAPRLLLGAAILLGALLMLWRMRRREWQRDVAPE